MLSIPLCGSGGLVVKSCLTLAIPCTVAHQAPLSMGFPRQEYWNGLPFPSPDDLPNLGIEPGSPTWQADALSSEPPGRTLICHTMISAVPLANIHSLI